MRTMADTEYETLDWPMRMNGHYKQSLMWLAKARRGLGPMKIGGKIITPQKMKDFAERHDKVARMIYHSYAYRP